ncbi:MULTISPECIES: ABC transporter substrate-binding protein [unclassified Shinella]|uniref:ABC transporter substrate-binding protein n=1 Tax=unclassified Shinella TaxID=2643062 RepID=UPI00225C4E32|nr:MULTISPECIES: ABC transporter substrate-binding protein [unclassified Shinella]CAI0334228.1 NMT1/THI5-like domain-containing protein [Rhizobiaceae bacterium]CAK7261884.1 NitT/TauT family transport system substrate-binding protein [Shinella sp. WSC3-e]MDC7259635.1 ABC transporter substrate-binding protein [Shinella sp. YE25]MDC7266832.1 ABC transporter substrate-binding protein [Shinella sp. HY16]MDC7273729.1 ABC transporter substrate-binding protein [Shinella sp. YZ44]
MDVKRRLAGLFVSTAVLFTVGSGTGSAEEQRKVPFVIGNPLMIQAVYELYVPLAMGWWRDAGYDIQVQYMPGSSAAVQGIIGKSASVGMMNTTPWMVADTKEFSDIRMAAVMTNSLWRVITETSSDITKPQDLKGKKVGLAVGGSGGSMYLDSLLANNGMDPNRDVQKIVIGMGAQAQEMLRSGRVDASLAFTPEIATYQALGGKVNFIYDDAWLRFPDYGFVATEGALKTDTKMVETLARGVAMAQVFAEANPECVAKIYRKNWAPDRSTTLAQDTLILKSMLEERRLPFEAAGGKLHGKPAVAGLGELQEFLHKNGLIETPVDPARFVADDPEFYSRINDFSKDDVVAQATKCEGY